MELPIGTMVKDQKMDTFFDNFLLRVVYLLSLSRTGPKAEQPTFKCNICFNSTHRTS